MSRLMRWLSMFLILLAIWSLTWFTSWLVPLVSMFGAVVLIGASLIVEEEKR